jgi:hypothetical protein
MAAWKASLNVIGWRSPAVVDSHFDTMSRKMNPRAKAARAKDGTRVGEAAAEGQHHGLVEHQRYASAELARSALCESACQRAAAPGGAATTVSVTGQYRGNEI